MIYDISMDELMVKYEEAVAKCAEIEDCHVFTFDELMREFEDGGYWDGRFGDDGDLKTAFKACIPLFGIPNDYVSSDCPRSFVVCLEDVVDSDVVERCRYGSEEDQNMAYIDACVNEDAPMWRIIYGKYLDGVIRYGKYLDGYYNAR